MSASVTAPFPDRSFQLHAAVRPQPFLWALVAAYIVCLPVQIDTSAGFRFAPSDVFLILYTTFAAASWKLYRPQVWTIWHVAILFSFAFATLNAQLRHGELNQYVVLNKDIGLLVLYATYAMLTAESRAFRDIRRLLRVFVSAVACVNTLALISFFGIVPWLAENVFKIVFDGRLAGMLVDPNAYGGLLSVTIAIHGNTYFSQKPLIRGLPGLYILVSLLVGVVYTFSRSTWISVAAMIAILCITRPKVGALAILSIATGISGFLLLTDPATLDNMVYMATRPSQVDSRLDTMAHAIPHFLSSPVLGVGLGSFTRDYGIIIHNTPLWFLTELGLVGFISFVGFYCWFLVNGYRAYRSVDASERPLILGLILAHIAILGLSMGIEVLYQRHWWFVMAMTASAVVAARTSASRTHIPGEEWRGR